jgi:MarR family transcriptional regulator, transcriptional regulator for hemolysin
MTSTAETFSMLLTEATRAARNKMDKRLKPLGLTQSKWMVLVQLAAAEAESDTVTQTDLAARLGIETPSLVGLLDRLGRDQLIERRESPLDRRCKLISFTPKGREVLKQIKKIGAGLRQELLEGTTEDELLTCVQVLQRMKEKAESL